MKSRYAGFFLLELALTSILYLIIIAVFLKCIQFTVALNSKTIEQINCHENQRFVFQTLRQQLGFYAKQVKIVNGPAGPVLIIKETAENRQVSYYRGQEQYDQGVLYQAIQIKQNQPGVNQLTDPHNVKVVDFKVEPVDSQSLLVTLVLQDKRTHKLNRQQEYIPILNGKVL